MGAKIHDMGEDEVGYRNLVFHCPGCGYGHPFRIGHGAVDLPTWTWNGSFDKPTFTPSLLCNKDHPASRCHSFVTDGRIAFLSDCWHSLAGQTVEIPDWD
jgi:hypothetical protein